MGAMAFKGWLGSSAAEDKPKIANYKHQITNKFQITISKFQMRSKTNYLEF
jgi:hypothetical protein